MNGLRALRILHIMVQWYDAHYALKKRLIKLCAHLAATWMNLASNKTNNLPSENIQVCHCVCMLECQYSNTQPWSRAMLARSPRSPKSLRFWGRWPLPSGKPTTGTLALFLPGASVIASHDKHHTHLIRIVYPLTVHNKLILITTKRQLNNGC